MKVLWDIKLLNANLIKSHITWAVIEVEALSIVGEPSPPVNLKSTIEPLFSGNRYHNIKLSRHFF